MTPSIAVVDIGGTSIKFSSWNSEELCDSTSVKTPDNLEDFYDVIENNVNELKSQKEIVGVAFSSPGSVNKETGIIEGASALPYIHNFKIKNKLEKILELPISIENDANCAALAELTMTYDGKLNNAVFLVIGTGIGGSLIIDKKIVKGSHLLGGEFGYMLVEPNQTLSDICSPVNMARRYNSIMNSTIDGEKLFLLSDQGDLEARKETDLFYTTLSRVIYNLQYSFDPEMVLIGGAISNNEKVINELVKRTKECVDSVEIANVMPNIAACKYKGAANLVGAAIDFETEFGKDFNELD